MTNEELVYLIQQGDDGHLPTLWEQVRRLIALKAERYAYALSIDDRHVDVEDLIQEGYFAVLDAVSYYDPTSDLKFTTYLNNTLKNAFRTVAGLRTSRRDPLDRYISLDITVGEDSDTSFMDLIGDPRSSFEEFENNFYNHELRKALDNAMAILTDREYEVLTLKFYFGVSYHKQADNRGCTPAGIVAIAKSAFSRIRSSEHMKMLAAFNPNCDFDPYRHTSFSEWESRGSVQECYLLRDESVKQLLL